MPDKIEVLRLVRQELLTLDERRLWVATSTGRRNTLFLTY